MSNTRLYYVTDSLDTGASPRLIEATSGDAALRHVTRARFACRAAKPRDVAHAMTLGAAPEKAGADIAQETFDGIVGDGE